MGNGESILLVDDEPQILEAYREVFSQAGYAALTAASAEEALEVVQETPAWVFFLDLHLPGMNGLELCRRLHADYPMAICYAATGYTSLFEMHECRDAGFQDYFLKPVRRAALLEAAALAFQKLERWAQALPQSVWVA